MPNRKEVPEGTHLVEIRNESYGYTLAHVFNNRVMYVATYPNRMEVMRCANAIIEREQAEGHEVMLATDSRLG